MRIVQTYAIAPAAQDAQSGGPMAPEHCSGRERAGAVRNMNAANLSVGAGSVAALT
jgi:hypothetical protein